MFGGEELTREEIELIKQIKARESASRKEATGNSEEEEEEDEIRKLEKMI